MSSEGPKNSTKHFILDAGPLLTGYIVFREDTRYHTVPAVIAEIKDAASKARLAALPFKLDIREPSAESFSKVWEYSRAVSGDGSVLSKTDLQVVALTLDLAAHYDGYSFEEHREQASTPVKPHIGKRNQPRPADDSKESENVSSAAGDELASTEPVKEDESDEGEWITPSNFDQHKQKDLLKLTGIEKAEDFGKSKRMVTCMSSDFAIQNVLLRLGLSVCSVDGKMIAKLKSWMLRCHACTWYTTDMARRFCDRCGGPTLLRTSYELDAQGQAHFFLARNFQYKLRGTRFDLPMPKGGRPSPNSTPLITREDQREYIRACKQQQKQESKELRSMLNTGGSGSASSSAALADLDERLASVFGSMDIASDVMKKAARSASASPRIAIASTGRKNPNEVCTRRK